MSTTAINRALPDACKQGNNLEYLHRTPGVPGPQAGKVAQRFVAGPTCSFPAFTQCFNPKLCTYIHTYVLWWFCFVESVKKNVYDKTIALCEREYSCSHSYTKPQINIWDLRKYIYHITSSKAMVLFIYIHSIHSSQKDLPRQLKRKGEFKICNTKNANKIPIK